MRLTPVHVLQEQQLEEVLPVDTNPFISSDPEITDLVGAGEYPVDSIMLASFYADYYEARINGQPDYYDEVAYSAIEFESIEDAGQALTSMIGDDPAGVFLLLKENVLVILYRDSADYGDECFFWLREQLEETTEQR